MTPNPLLPGIVAAKPDDAGSAQTVPPGLRYYPSMLDCTQQNRLLDSVRRIVDVAPLYVPTMPRTGQPMRVQMTNCGSLGWVSDKAGGYRYQAFHPKTHQEWPAIPKMLIELWNRLGSWDGRPEACLINYYGKSSKMGLHQDRDETNLAAPVLSISLGDSCRFRIRRQSRSGEAYVLNLSSGDVLVMGGESRLYYHGVDRVFENTSELLSEGGRINLTLRCVHA